jgi:hypothetical protein
MLESFADYSETSFRIYSWFFSGPDFLVLFACPAQTWIKQKVHDNLFSVHFVLIQNEPKNQDY